mgnify:CR=1 FL=1
MRSKIQGIRFPVGLRTLKTAVAVAASILLVERYGTSADELLFGVMGVFSAMEPTFKASVRGCIAQFSGVIVGVLLSLAIRAVEIPGVVAAGVGIILVMALYQIFHWKTSPVLPCLILVTICTDPELGAVAYGAARIWNTALGLAVGMAINMLVFPYDTSRKMQQAMISLDDDLILFLEDRFDGDDHLPETAEMSKKIESMERQLEMFADQRLLRRRRQKRTLAKLLSCEDTARALLLEVQTLRSMDYIGRLNKENRTALRALGANISENSPDSRFQVEDLVVNYHVSRALHLRQKLKDELSRNINQKG